MIEQSLADQPVENVETVRAAKGGRRIDVAVSIQPVKSSAGVIVGMAEITRDITEQKFAEEKFRLAVESCPSGMLMVDRAGMIVMVNTEIERLFGYRRDELIGRSVDILAPTRLRAHHARHRNGFIQPAAHPAHGRRPRSVRAAQGRNRVPDRGRPQSDPDPGRACWFSAPSSTSASASAWSA